MQFSKREPGFLILELTRDLPKEQVLGPTTHQADPQGIMKALATTMKALATTMAKALTKAMTVALAKALASSIKG